MAKNSRVTKSPKTFVLRIHIVTVSLLLAGLLIVGRLSVLQVKDHQTWLEKASAQQENFEKEEPPRGEIKWRGKDGVLEPVAISKHVPYVFAVPKEVSDPEAAAKTLSQVLGLSGETLLKKFLKADDPYELLAKRLSQEIAEKIKALKLKGIYLAEERIRFYPQNSLASHVVGFVSESEPGKTSGKYGLEAFYDETLRGNGKSKDGSSLILTIDPNIQFEAERLLEESVKKWRGKSGTVIVLEPETGKILALANYPAFNPNEFNKVTNLEYFLNRSTSLRYEPGSVFKPFTMAAGLESGAVTKDTTYYDSGEVRVGDHTIRNAGNSAPKKEISMTRILERSYNVGAVFVSLKTGPDYMRKFLIETLRFEEKSGIDLPGELKNDFANLKSPEAKPLNFATAAFGQGLAVTPIKLTQAFNIFANGGYLVKPYVVEKIVREGGREIVTAPEKSSQVVSSRVLEDLIPMMESVVSGEQGSGKLAHINGYRIAGKTGTGDIPRSDGKGYYLDRVNHTFIGFGPVSSPRATILVRIEEPIGARYAEATAVPVFRDLMKFILSYYGIPPDKPEETIPQ